MTLTGTDQVLIDLRRRLSLAVFRICPGWLASDAEDIVQTAMMRVLDASRKRGEQSPDLSSLYVQKAAFSATVDEIRRRRRQVVIAEVTGPRLEARSPDGLNPETLAASREIAAGVTQCLAGLALPRRLAVTLHLQGQTAEEAASVLSWRVKQVQNLTYRGLADLRRCLAAKGLAR